MECKMEQYYQALFQLLIVIITRSSHSLVNIHFIRDNNVDRKKNSSLYNTLNAPHQVLEMTSDASPFALASFAAAFLFLLKLNREDVVKLHTKLRWETTIMIKSIKYCNTKLNG